MGPVRGADRILGAGLGAAPPRGPPGDCPGPPVVLTMAAHAPERPGESRDVPGSRDDPHRPSPRRIRGRGPTRTRRRAGPVVARDGGRLALPAPLLPGRS